MITETELKSYKEIIGSKYSRKIIDFFELKEYQKPSGEKYTTQDIRNFFYGRYNQSLHIKVIEAVKHFQILKGAIAKSSEELLKTKKPEAVTPGDSHN